MIKVFYYIIFFFLALYAFVFIRSYFTQFKFKHREVVNVYFGVPGSGKTTYAAYLAKVASHKTLAYRIEQKYNRYAIVKFLFRNVRQPLDVYSNVPIIGTYNIDPKRDLGVYLVQDGKIIIDEASIEYNNRNFKSLPQDTIKFFKLHRHYHTSIDVFSQSFDDMDITLRRLAHSYFLVKKSLFPYFIKVKKIYRKVGIDENTHQIADLFNFGFPFLDDQYIFMPTLWKMFDSYDAPELPRKDFPRWDRTSAVVPVPDADPDTGEVVDQSAGTPDQSDAFESMSIWS